MNRTTKAFLAVTAFVHAVSVAWVRRDARGRETDASPWDLLTALTGVFGLVGYLRSRR
ncbi:hypothetical protein SAMN04488063_2660 [Halopelagius inordinatus]|uniref:Uncharacterized protein n=1 Tax=Halopelagius inordinatus TaxID=553467 RepID=A0A1I2TEL7_9EURY|nr:hypothetical protein [Halopelagius inordinatus]SFG63270.1 hypothetical protein SAMN04488063_2660 [Halopelagius inordinatus]